MGLSDFLNGLAGRWLAVCAALTFSVGSGFVAAQPSASATSGRVPVSIALPAGSLRADSSQVLLELGSAAGVIFAGQVLAIVPDHGSVEITFQVERGVRECVSGSTYVLREWAGLWTSHPDRYRIGQHLLMFLTARTASGLSAPVNVTEGAIPLLAPYAPPLIGLDGLPPPDTGASPELMVDLSWLQTRVARASATSVSNGQGAVAARAQPVATGAWAGAATPLPVTANAALTSVVALLLAGTGESSAAR